MRRRVLKLMLIVAMVLLMSAPSVCSEQTSSPEVEIEVNVHKLGATTINLHMIHGADWLDAGAITWGDGDLQLDSGNHIFITDHYYAIEVDNSSYNWTAILKTTGVTGPGGSLNGNIRVSAYTMHPEGQDPNPSRDGNLGNIPATGWSWTKGMIGGSGHWLRIYVAIPGEHGTGNDGSWDPIPEAQAGGLYSGTITITYTTP